MTDRRCEDWRGAILDRVVDELPDHETVLLEQHLAECAACSRLMEATGSMLANWRECAPPAEEFAASPALEEGLLRRVRGSEMRNEGSLLAGRSPKGASAWSRVSWLILRPIPAYAVAILIVTSCCIGIWASATHDRDGAAPAGRLPSAAAPEPTSDPRNPARDAQRPRDRSFAVTPSDALCLIGSLGSDTL